MNISFVDTRVTRLNFELNETEGSEGNNLKLSFTSAFTELDNREFLIIFSIELTGIEFNLSAEYAARFATDEDIDDNFKESNFVKINAPAIAFPYLRAYIGNLTVNSGFQPVVLPTINFTKIEKK
jgi:preprotein translocase subunit SecB